MKRTNNLKQKLAGASMQNANTFFVAEVWETLLNLFRDFLRRRVDSVQIIVPEHMRENIALAVLICVCTR